MGNDLFAYIEKLELLAFFSAYPLIYTLARVINASFGNNYFTSKKLTRLLCITYALCGTLYLGLQLRNMYPGFQADELQHLFNSWIKIWGLLALLFWIPFFQKRPFLSLLHSLVIFFFLLKDLALHLANKTGKDTVKNDMLIFTDSLLLIAIIFILLCASDLVRSSIRRKNKPV
jgi:hypothetical protein